MSSDNRDRDTAGRRTPRSDRDRDRRRRDDRDRDRDRARSNERESQKKLSIKTILKRPTASGGGDDRGQTPIPRDVDLLNDFPELGKSQPEPVKPSGSGQIQIMTKPKVTESKNRENSDKTNVDSSAGDVNKITVVQRQHTPQPQPQSQPIPVPKPKVVAKTVSTCFKEKRAIPFVDKMILKDEESLDFITVNSKNKDFFVVSIIGTPRSGKSTILSYLANDNDLIKFGTNDIFPEHGGPLNCSIYKNREDTIFIEMASVFNGSSAYEMLNEPDINFGTLETSMTTLNLKMMRWALSISHLVIIVDDSLIDPNLFQLVNSAGIIAQLESAFGEDQHSDILYICNKTAQNKELKDLADQAQLLLNNVIGRPPRIDPNLFLLPHIKEPVEKGVTKDKYEELKNTINEYIVFNRAPFAEEIPGRSKFQQNITLKEWWNTAQIRFEEMSNLSFFSSYVKLFP